MSRSKVLEDYVKYFQKKDKRGMDAICNTKSTEFKLQVQQKFLKKYVARANWTSLLMYHKLGSGKTCTAITIAEELMRKNPRLKAHIILPARLRTNFIDELGSACGAGKYMSQDELVIYHDSDTPPKIKKKIHTSFMNRLSANYTIHSFEKFRKNALLAGADLEAWATDMTRNKIIIVDEIHNMLSSTYDIRIFERILATNRLLNSATGINTILMKYLVAKAHPTCKFIYLTATPVFDNIHQFRDLITILRPNVTLPVRPHISELINYLRGHVSYFPGTSQNAYPKKSYEIHDIKMSQIQDEWIYELQESAMDEENPLKEAFKIKERQASLIGIRDPKNIEDHQAKILGNMSKYCPKFKELLNQIKKPGKHLVFSNFIKIGLNVIQEAMKQRGWVNFKDVESLDDCKHNVYAVWDGSTPDSQKVAIKQLANCKRNVDGKYIRVILGSPSIKEGVSFKHIQHVHILDPVWNGSAKDQIEGRAIRFCSHIDIPTDHKVLKRQVKVHIYKMVPRSKGQVRVTADQYIYDALIPRKMIEIGRAEKALKKVAIDYHIFRNLYEDREVKKDNIRVRRPDDNSNANSIISLDDDKRINKKRKNRQRRKKTCPAARRPDKDTEECRRGYVARLNPHHELCCYKIKPPPMDASLKSCPKARRPPCKEGHIEKDNKHGAKCCYKVRPAPK